jgi:Cation efflux family
MLRLFLAALFAVALPIWRRSGRLSAAAVVGATVFLGVIEGTQMAIQGLRVSLSGLYLGWQQHAGLQQPSGVEKSTAVRESDAVTWAAVVLNVGLAAFKFFAGITGNSAAMVADAAHSLSDLLSDFVTLWAVKISRLPPDSGELFMKTLLRAIYACCAEMPLCSSQLKGYCY